VAEICATVNSEADIASADEIEKLAKTNVRAAINKLLKSVIDYIQYAVEALGTE